MGKGNFIFIHVSSSGLSFSSHFLILSHLDLSLCISYYLIQYVFLILFVLFLSVLLHPVSIFVLVTLSFLTLSHLSFLFLLFFFCIICSVFILSLILPLLFFRSCLSFVSCNMACPSHLICSILSYFSHVALSFLLLISSSRFLFSVLFLCLMSSPCLSFLQFLPHLVIFPSHPVSPSYVSGLVSLFYLSHLIWCVLLINTICFVSAPLVSSLPFLFSSNHLFPFLHFLSHTFYSHPFLSSSPCFNSCLILSLLFISSCLSCLSQHLLFPFSHLDLYCLTMSHLSFFLPFFPFSIIFSCLCF